MGSYPGVGIEVAAEDGVSESQALDGSPTQQRDWKAGTRFSASTSHDIGADLPGAIAHMRGPPGAGCGWRFRREGTPGLIEFDLRRAEVEVHSVTCRPSSRAYGYGDHAFHGHELRMSSTMRLAC